LFVEAEVAQEAGRLLWQNRRKIVTVLRSVRAKILGPTSTVLVFGASGVGKTTFGRFLSGIRPEDLARPYAESRVVETYPLRDDPLCHIIVNPGQPAREERWKPALRRITRGGKLGIVSLVSWGYHSFGDLSYNEMDQYQQGMTTSEFVIAYSEDRRQREVEILKSVATRLKDADHPVWMLTLVAKQDLWWADRRAVREHYEQGEYAAVIANISETLGGERFQHEYVSTSFVIQNLLTDQRELLVPTSAGYDQQLQYSNTLRVVEALNDFA
jgi:energy-coupling factor transporter ATP-binding protein EcfA2